MDLEFLINPELVFSAVSLIGMAAVSRHEYRLAGFIICAFGNILWITWGLIIWHVGYLVLFGGYFIFNSIGTHDEYVIWNQMKRFNNDRERRSNDERDNE